VFGAYIEDLVISAACVLVLSVCWSCTKYRKILQLFVITMLMLMNQQYIFVLWAHMAKRLTVLSSARA